jgi:hypothetical protein
MDCSIPYIVQTCDAGKHRRKDRPNGGMYIGKGEVNLTIAAMQPQETLVVKIRKKKSCQDRLQRLIVV